MKTAKYNRLTKMEKSIFELRCAQHLPDAHEALSQLYSKRSDFEDIVNRFINIARSAYVDRPADLRTLDLARMHMPDWYQQSNMVGYICYVDRFAKTIKGMNEKLPYLDELGVNYLHLMPLLQPRPAPNDGGYAVMDYRQVDKRLGSMRDLSNLAKSLRERGISLCTDLVCNHVAGDHEWAKKAAAGDLHYQDYFFTFPDRAIPDQYEKTLREIFPASAPGSFTFNEEMQRWVWTTFHPYQWDLNYKNPAVLGEMLDIILYLANQGVEILRMDAVAFMWKEMGTTCENLPQAHAILQALRALSRIAAPGLLLKAEAIVAPDDVVPYLGQGQFANKECELAYHNTLMVYLWSMLAERNVALSTYSLQKLPIFPSGAAWVNYVRCHDDIGWAIMDDYAADIGLNGFQHRSFLSDFYSGNFEGSFARGDVFEFNPATLDRRISGACASLAGLEAAADSFASDLAIRRILLIHNIIFAAGGIPLIYMGDELGLLNDYSYLESETTKNDNRWMHRPYMDWQLAKQRHNRQNAAGRLFQGIKHIATARKNTPALHSQATSTAIWTHNDHVFGLLRESARGRLLILGNFTEEPQTVQAERLQELGFGTDCTDHLSGKTIAGWMNIQLQPYQAMWLQIK